MVNSFDYAYSYDVLAIGSKLNDFLFLNEIGRGSFGVVNKVKSLLDNKIYAIKKLNLKNMKEDSQREAIEEVIILKKLDHPHFLEEIMKLNKLQIFIFFWEQIRKFNSNYSEIS